MSYASTDDTSPLSPLGACGYPPSFLENLAAMEARARAQHCAGALVLVEIDNFSMMMSGYSVPIAEALMEGLQALIAAHNPQGVTARVQRDQFGVLLPEINAEDAEAWCLSLHDAIRNYSYHSDYGEVRCLVSTACQTFPDRIGGASELLARALVRLTHEEGDAVFQGELTGGEHREEMGLANFLSQAVQEGRMRLAYQPIINARTGAVAHYEALLRLYGHDGRITSGGALIPIAERMGFIAMIDKLVLSKVIAELKHDPDVVLAINVSNLTTRDPSYLGMLMGCLGDAPEIAKRLIIEITETAVHGDLRHTARFCAEVQALGCQVALDDFGAGYTSFRQLKALSVDAVKIDGAFIRDLSDNADSRFFVKTLLDFTRGFGLVSVAEFVENGEIAKMLMELGVDYLQGYYFSKPLNHRPWLKEGEYSKD